MESIDLGMEDIFGGEENQREDFGAEQNEVENNEENQNEENTFDANVSAKLAKGAAKKVVRNPQPKLDPQRLSGQRGIAILPKLFENVKFKGKGYEAQDLEKVIKGLEHWAHRLFPKRTFNECLQIIDKLGNKRGVKTCIKKIRLDMPLLDEDFVSKPETNEDTEMNQMDEVNEAENAFDEMMQTSTSQWMASPSTSQITNGLITSSPTTSKPKTVLSDEQKEMIERNKRLAMERRAQRLQNQNSQNPDVSTQNSEGEKTQSHESLKATTEQQLALDVSIASHESLDISRETNTPVSKEIGHMEVDAKQLALDVSVTSNESLDISRETNAPVSKEIGHMEVDAKQLALDVSITSNESLDLTRKETNIPISKEISHMELNAKCEATYDEDKQKEFCSEQPTQMNNEISVLSESEKSGLDDNASETQNLSESLSRNVEKDSSLSNEKENSLPPHEDDTVEPPLEMEKSVDTDNENSLENNASPIKKSESNGLFTPNTNGFSEVEKDLTSDHNASLEPSLEMEKSVDTDDENSLENNAFPIKKSESNGLLIPNSHGSSEVEKDLTSDHNASLEPSLEIKKSVDTDKENSLENNASPIKKSESNGLLIPNSHGSSEVGKDQTSDRNTSLSTNAYQVCSEGEVPDSCLQKSDPPVCSKSFDSNTEQSTED